MDIKCGIHYIHCHGNKAYKDHEFSVANLTLSELESQTNCKPSVPRKINGYGVDKIIHHVKEFT